VIPRYQDTVEWPITNCTSVCSCLCLKHKIFFCSFSLDVHFDKQFIFLVVHTCISKFGLLLLQEYVLTNSSMNFETWIGFFRHCFLMHLTLTKLYRASNKSVITWNYFWNVHCVTTNQTWGQIKKNRKPQN